MFQLHAAANRGHIADLPADVPEPTIEELRDYVYAGGVHVPRRPIKAVQLYEAMARAGRVAPPPVERYEIKRPMLGYSVREVSFLGMPFGWWTEFGWSLYAETDTLLIAGVLQDEGLARLEENLGKDIHSGHIFPFWEHCWGWLYLAALGLWGWLRLRWVREQREAEGLI